MNRSKFLHALMTKESNRQNNSLVCKNVMEIAINSSMIFTEVADFFLYAFKIN